jgi:hydrogenase maturation protease
MIFIVGYGNTLRCDDGFGPAVITALEDSQLIKDYGQAQSIELVSGQQLLPEYAERLARAKLAIIIDAAFDGELGTVSCTELIADGSVTATPPVALSHTLSPQALVDMALVLYGRAPKTLLFTASGASFELGEGLSDRFAGAVQDAVSMILSRLASGAASY